MKKENRCLNGYFTIEATFIMGITLFCIVLLIYLGFYQYNRCLIGQDAYRLAMKGSTLQFADNDEIYQKVSKEYHNFYWKKYMAMEISEPLISVEGNRVAIIIEGKISMPFSGRDKWSITKECESKRIVPTQIIKMINRLEDGF